MKALMASMLMLFFYTTAISQTNIALGKTVTSSSGGSNLSNIVDGNFSTFGSTGTSLSQPHSEWIMVDLGADYFIDSVLIGCQSGTTGHNHLRRFFLVTYPSALSNLGDNPTSYTATSSSAYNRLIYTSGSLVTGGTTTPFGNTASSPANPNIPGTAGVSLGPDFPTSGTMADKQGFNIGTTKARYILLMNLQDDVLDPTEIQVFSTNISIRSIQNGSFEQGTTSTGAGLNVREALVNGWNTTEAVGMWSGDTTVPTQGSDIEFWSTNIAVGGSTGTVPSFSGNYFVELNAFIAGQLDQRQICVLAGESFNFGVAHRGRTGLDSSALRINDVDVAKIWDDKVSTSGATHHGASVLQSSTTTITTTPASITNGWGYYTGTWTNITGSNMLVNFGFRAISANGGSIGVGNFLDSVTFSGLDPTISFNQDSSQGSKTVPTASLPKLYLIGSVSSPLTLTLNITGGTATRGVNYTTTPSTGLITMTIPVGNYDGTAATAVSLSPYIQIVNDGMHDADLTINMTIQTPSTGLKLADANICGPAITNAVYTIKDGTLPLTLISFTAQKQDDNTGLLNWHTATEINTTTIAIEKSTPGVLGFTEIGRVTPKGDNSYYSFTDDHLVSGMNYYRLKIIDRDGRYDYSEIRAIKNSNDNVEMHLFPNPASSTAKLTLPIIGNSQALIRLYNTSGSLIQTINATGKQVIDIDISKMSKGLYMVTYYNGSELYSKKIFKQ